MNRLQEDKKFLTIAQSEIVEASTHVQIPIDNINVKFPAKIDDFQTFDRIVWAASVGPVGSKLDKDTVNIGGSFAYVEPPNYDDWRMAMRRSALFALIIETVPAKPFIYQAQHIYQRFNNVEDITVASWMNAVVSTIAKSVDDLDRKLADDPTYSPNKKPMIGLNTAFRVVNDQLKGYALDDLKQIYNRMGEERMRIIKEAQDV